MRRTLALAALAAGLAGVLPASPASACDEAHGCPNVCATFDHYWFVVQSVLADPPPKPIC